MKYLFLILLLPSCVCAQNGFYTDSDKLGLWEYESKADTFLIFFDSNNKLYNLADFDDSVNDDFYYTRSDSLFFSFNSTINYRCRFGDSLAVGENGADVFVLRRYHSDNDTTKITIK